MSDHIVPPITALSQGNFELSGIGLWQSNRVHSFRGDTHVINDCLFTEYLKILVVMLTCDNTARPCSHIKWPEGNL